MKNSLFLTFIFVLTITPIATLLAESTQEKKERIAQDKKDKIDAKTKRKAAYQEKEKKRKAEKKARQKKIAAEKNSPAERSKKWDDYVPARFMTEQEKGFSPNKTDSINHINDSFTF